jgi:hypothetical protein
MMNRIIETPDGFDIEVNGRRFGTWRSRAEASAGLKTETLRALAKDQPKANHR